VNKNFYKRNRKAVNNSKTSTWRHHHLLYELCEGWVGRTLEKLSLLSSPIFHFNLQFFSFIVAVICLVAHYIECFFALFLFFHEYCCSGRWKWGWNLHNEKIFFSNIFRWNEIDSILMNLILRKLFVQYRKKFIKIQIYFLGRRNELKFVSYWIFYVSLLEIFMPLT